MSTEAIGWTSTRRYSARRWRFLGRMVARRALEIVNSSASHLLVKPVVVLAARTLGPGPTRLRLVKLAHTLTPINHDAVVVELPREAQDQDARPTRRAA